MDKSLKMGIPFKDLAKYAHYGMRNDDDINYKHGIVFSTLSWKTFDKRIDLFMKLSALSGSDLIAMALKAIAFSPDNDLRAQVTEYLEKTKLLDSDSLDCLIKILKENILKTDLEDKATDPIEMAMADLVINVMTDNHREKLAAHISKLEQLTTTTYPWSVSQAILKNPVLPNLLTQKHLYKVALEHEGRAKLIITNPVARKRLSELQVGELAKTYPNLRAQILNLNQAGEQKIPNDTILFLFEAKEHEARQLLLEKYALNPDISVATWLNLFSASSEKVQNAVVDSWEKLKDKNKDEDRLLLLEKFFNCGFVIKGSILYDFCSKNRFFTRWILPFPKQLDSTFKAWEGRFSLLKRDYDSKSVPDTGHIRKTDVARLCTKLHNFEGDLYQSKLSTTMVQSFFGSFSSSTSKTSSLEEPGCTPGTDIKAQGKNPEIKNDLAHKKQIVVDRLESLDFAEGKLTKKGELQLCADILTLIEQQSEKVILFRFNKTNETLPVVPLKPIVKRFKPIQDKLNPILSYWNKHKAELKANPDFKLDKINPGLTIMEKYYSSIGLQLNSDYEFDGPPPAENPYAASSSSMSSQSSAAPLGYVPPSPENPDVASSSSTSSSSVYPLISVTPSETEAKPAYKLLYDLNNRVEGCLSIEDRSFLPVGNLLKIMGQDMEMINKFAPVERGVLRGLTSPKENDLALISTSKNSNNLLASPKVSSSSSFSTSSGSSSLLTPASNS